MDTAVSLVETYLRVNGYFTVTEFPVLESLQEGEYRTLTDLDILAVRFPGARRLVPSRRGHIPEVLAAPPEPQLNCAGGCIDMIIGEVKEGRAELNEAARNPLVLEAVLTRFGCCTPNQVPNVVHRLLQKGHAHTPSGYHVRLVAFGSTVGADGGPRHAVVSLGHVVEFLREYIRQNWDMLRHTDSKDPVFAFLVILEKGAPGVCRGWALDEGQAYLSRVLVMR